MLIDIHAHLDMLETSPEETLAKARSAGVSRIITIGTEPSDHQIVLDIAQRLFPAVSCTLGVHPHQGAVWNDEVAKFIDANVTRPEVVAVGEIGLDYHYNQSPQAEQREAFRRQLDLAAKHHMPVQIHTRDAEADTVEILKDYKGRVTGVIHCFTGSAWLGEQCLNLGFNLSFSGVVTFKNAQELRETCQRTPLDRLHVETDAPFLTPVPLRGQKNTPAFVTHTADFVAQLHGVSREQLDEQTNANARQVFPKIKW